LESGITNVVTCVGNAAEDVADTIENVADTKKDVADTVEDVADAVEDQRPKTVIKSKILFLPLISVTKKQMYVFQTSLFLERAAESRRYLER